jgi:AcrR family transcriptional regulator
MKAPIDARPPGQPRDPSTDWPSSRPRSFSEQVTTMSVEGWRRGRVGKATIYRRYPGKRELVVAAIRRWRHRSTAPDTGSARDDLRLFVDQTSACSAERAGFSMVGTLLAKERDEPALIELFRAAILRPRIEIAYGIVRRGIERGEIRPDVSVELLVQLLPGAILARHLVGQPEDEAWLDAVFDTLWRGVAARH